MLTNYVKKVFCQVHLKMCNCLLYLILLSMSNHLRENKLKLKKKNVSYQKQTVFNGFKYAGEILQSTENGVKLSSLVVF